MSSRLQELHKEYGIRPEDVLILDSEPWLTSNQLAMIARKSGGFVSIDVDFKEFIAALNQVIWRATLVGTDQRVYARSGVAKLGEALPTGAKTNEHDLAASRALRSALAMAGFDVLRSGSNSKSQPRGIEIVADVRQSQLRQIHALAEECSLIQAGIPGEGRDVSGYRAFLQEHYNVDSVAGMTESERASVIQVLTMMKRQYDEL
jgi:hypothetical protein